MASQKEVTLSRRTGYTGEWASIPVTDPAIHERLVHAVNAIEDNGRRLRVRFSSGVSVLKLQLPKAVGIFTDGVVECWGGCMICAPGTDRFLDDDIPSNRALGDLLRQVWATAQTGGTPTD